MKTFTIVTLLTVVISVLFIMAVEPIQRWLETPAVFWATVVSIITFLATMVWVWTRDKTYVLLGSPDNKRRRDLRLWAFLCSVLMILAYIIFA
jgi:cytochrome bd-type quinol oxidase subunit 2